LNIVIAARHSRAAAKREAFVPFVDPGGQVDNLLQVFG